jgi:hypothetical protein
MRMPQYHRVRTAIQENAVPGSGRDVASVAATLRAQLMESGVFETVEVEPTEDPDRLVIALCQFGPEVSEWDVTAQLERIWSHRIRYEFWEAHAYLADDDHVELEGATRIGTGGHYVTVHLIAEKLVPEQRRPAD